MAVSSQMMRLIAGVAIKYFVSSTKTIINDLLFHLVDPKTKRKIEGNFPIGF